MAYTGSYRSGLVKSRDELDESESFREKHLYKRLFDLNAAHLAERMALMRDFVQRGVTVEAANRIARKALADAVSVDHRDHVATLIDQVERRRRGVP